MDDTHQDNSERAETLDLAGAVGRILPALQEFLRFEGEDPALLRDSWQARLEEPLPERGAGADAVLKLVAEVVIPAGLRIGAPGFCGWVTTGPTVVPAAAGFAGSVATPQKWFQSSGNFLEALGLRWLQQLLGLPAAFAGSFVSGGAQANLLGLAAARQHAGEGLGFDPAAEGVRGLTSPRIYASQHVHHVVLRALGLLGLGRAALVLIPTDVRKGPDLEHLRRMILGDLKAGRNPVAVVASAGDVNTGTIDPLGPMGEIAREHQLWFHVDGAYGGFGVLDPRVRDLYGGFAHVDSLAVDPHKWLAAPVGCGAGFVRDGDLLARALALEPSDYVHSKAPPAPSRSSVFDSLGAGDPDHSTEHSAPSRGLVVWAILKEIGVEGVRARVARHLDCARLVASRVRSHPDLELLAEPVLSICCFRVHPPRIRASGELERLNEAVLAEVRARGRSVPSSTRVNNKLAIRPCFIGARAGLEEADLLVDEVLRAARKLIPPE
ncbi:MAG: pyridoxal-dependent decarboxylase [Planctomycetota bacterium]